MPKKNPLGNKKPPVLAQNVPKSLPAKMYQETRGFFWYILGVVRGVFWHIFLWGGLVFGGGFLVHVGGHSLVHFEGGLWYIRGGYVSGGFWYVSNGGVSGTFSGDYLVHSKGFFVHFGGVHGTFQTGGFWYILGGLQYNQKGSAVQLGGLCYKSAGFK